MSEFFLELFSEEIPPNLQISARENLISNFTGFFEQKKINYNKNYYCYEKNIHIFTNL